MLRHSTSAQTHKKMKLKNGPKVIIRDLVDSELTDVYSLIQLPEVFDKGFGLETYPDEANFKKKMTLADKYVLEEDVNQNIIAYIIIHKSRFNRGVRNADALIIVRPECMSPDVLETCLSLAISLARAARFRGLYVDTFASNTEVMKAVRGIPGFSEVAQLPSWTLDHSDVTSIIFYKELDIRTQCFQCCI